MESTDQSSKKNLLYTACGGLILAAGGLYYYLKPKASNGSETRYSREDIISVLKKFKRNYYPIYRDLWTTSERINQNYRMRYGAIPEAVKKTLTSALMDNNPNFKRLMAKLEEDVYSEFNITDRKVFEKAADDLSKTDNEVKLLMQEIRDNVAKACNGVKLPMKIPLPDHVTAETTLKVYKSMVYSILMRLNEFLEDYVKENGVINTFEEEFNRKLGDVLAPEKVKSEFMKLHRYDSSDEYHENYVYACAIKQFSNNDKKYATVIQRIDFMNNNLLKQHLTPGQDFNKLKDKIEEIMLVGIELTQPIIDVVPNAQMILDKKAEEEAKKKLDEKAEEDKVVENESDEKPEDKVSDEKPEDKVSDEKPEDKVSDEKPEEDEKNDVVTEKTEEPVEETEPAMKPEETPEPVVEDEKKDDTLPEEKAELVVEDDKKDDTLPEEANKDDVVVEDDTVEVPKEINDVNNVPEETNKDDTEEKVETNPESED